MYVGRKSIPKQCSNISRCILLSSHSAPPPLPQPAGQRRRSSIDRARPAPAAAAAGQLLPLSVTAMAAERVRAAAALFCFLTGLAGGASRPSVCQDDFLIKEGTIIRTVDSRRRGATFLNNTEVAETSKCLEACCDRAGCNAAIYDQKVSEEQRLKVPLLC